MTLVEICDNKKLHGPANLGTDKELCHKYLSSFYDPFFAPLRDKPIKLLEIGVLSGASLALWRSYFSAAEIHGIDIIAPPFVFNTMNVAYAQGDAYNPAYIATLGTYDIIIDDGPHSCGSHLELVRGYYSKLVPGGHLIIEDIDYDTTALLDPEIERVFKTKASIIDNRAITKNNNSKLLLITKCS